MASGNNDEPISKAKFMQEIKAVDKYEDMLELQILLEEKNDQAIVNMEERLPEQTVQEDPNILMYYDISLSRV